MPIGKYMDRKPDAYSPVGRAVAAAALQLAVTLIDGGDKYNHVWAVDRGRPDSGR
jgi:hypothetical protein